MKNIEEKLIEQLKAGKCAPQIAQLARSLKEPATTIHYNIHRMQKEGKIKACHAVFDHAKIGQPMCTYVLITLSPDEYADPERFAAELAKHPQIESVDIITGDWEMLLKVRTAGMDEYYALVKSVLSKKGINKIKSLQSMKQLKSEFIPM